MRAVTPADWPDRMRFCSGDAGAVSSLRAVQTSTTAVDDGSERRASSPVRTRSWYRFCHCVSRVPRSRGRYIGPTVLDRKGLPALFRISLWGLISVIGIPCSPERCPNGERRHPLPLPPRRPPTSRPTGRRLAGTSPQAWDRLTLIIWPSTAHGKRRNAAFPNHAQSTGTMIRNLSSTILHCGAPAPGQPKRSR